MLDDMRMYSLDEIRELVDKAIDLGLEDFVEPSMTIAELDKLVNEDAN